MESGLKQRRNRFWALLLVLSIVVGLLPVNELQAADYNVANYTGSVGYFDSGDRIYTATA